MVEIDEETGEFHKVTDPEEAKVVHEALQDKSRRLAGEEALAYLKARLKEYGSANVQEHLFHPGAGLD